MMGLNFNVVSDDFRREFDTYKEAVSSPPTYLLDCPQFRILIIGQAGVGKSTICSKVFDIPDAKSGVSHRTPGTKVHQVWTPITFPGQNENIILHDSGGFEAGDKKSMDEIEQFITFRKQQPNIADQLHCIWYCISCADNRPIQSAERNFFREVDVGKIPVLAVFTQFDLLEAIHESRLRRKYRNENPNATTIPVELEDWAHLKAIADYDKHYRRALEDLIGLNSRVGIERVAIPDVAEASGSNVNFPREGAPNTQFTASGVDILIKRTLNMLTQDGLRLLWTTAQRESADLKLQESVRVGMELFWRVQGGNITPLVPFIGATAIYLSFSKILDHISFVWSLLDPNRILQAKGSRNRFLEGCFDASVTQIIGYGFLLAINMTGPLSAPQTAITILKMIAGVTLIHERLFWLQKSQDPPPLTEDQFRTTVAEFRGSQERERMAYHIDGAIDISRCYSKTACHQAVLDAIDIARSNVGREYTRRETLAN